MIIAVTCGILGLTIFIVACIFFKRLEKTTTVFWI